MRHVAANVQVCPGVIHKKITEMMKQICLFFFENSLKCKNEKSVSHIIHLTSFWIKEDNESLENQVNWFSQASLRSTH